MSKYIPELHRDQARLRYWASPEKFRERKRIAKESKMTPAQLEALQEKRRKHAEYMRAYYEAHPGYKAAADAKHRAKYLMRLRRRDRWRNMLPDRKAKRIACARQRRQSNPESFKEYAREYYRKNKHKFEENQRIRRSRPIEVRREEHRRYTLKHQYGLTIEKYDEILANQNGVCAICGDPPRVGFNKRLHVDHDHKTGKLRGLLCMHCNHAIERLDKYPDWAVRAQEYLERPR